MYRAYFRPILKAHMLISGCKPITQLVSIPSYIDSRHFYTYVWRCCLTYVDLTPIHCPSLFFIDLIF